MYLLLKSYKIESFVVGDILSFCVWDMKLILIMLKVLLGIKNPGLMICRSRMSIIQLIPRVFKSLQVHKSTPKKRKKKCAKMFYRVFEIVYACTNRTSTMDAYGSKYKILVQNFNKNF